MVSRSTYSSVASFTPREHQQEYLIDNTINQLKLYYSGSDTRNLVLNALTGSGKTFASISGLIPEWIRQFYPKGKSVIGFMTHFLEVVDATYQDAKSILDFKVVETSKGPARIRVYSSDDIKHHIKNNIGLDGDIIIVLVTADFFSSRIDEFVAGNGGLEFDLMIVDEAHFRFGTISAEDTKADKGATNNKFMPVTLTQLRERVNCATLFMTATPTNSQQELTDIGSENNVYLPEFPTSTNFVPAYQILEYPTNDLTVEEGLVFYGKQLELMRHTIKQINDETWKVISPKFSKTYIASMLRLARRGAKNGVDFEENIDRIEMLEADINAVALTSTSKKKEFFGSKIKSLNEGIQLAKKHNTYGICINVIDSGYAGLNLPKIKNIIIGREPSGTIANNYIQIAGRAARMMFFASHADAIAYIRGLPISDEQKRWVAEYYMLANTANVHVPADSDMLTVDVRNYFENASYRPDQLRSKVLQGIFGDAFIPGGMYLTTTSTLQDDSYKQFQKDHCEVCPKSNGNHTDCFVKAWEGLSLYLNRFVPEEEAQEFWLKVLNIHHKDSNHFNNDPDNLLTVCPNVHGMYTMHDEDYNNRYDALREQFLVENKA